MSDIPKDTSDVAQDDVGADIDESIGADIDTSEIPQHKVDTTPDTILLGDDVELRFDELKPNTRYEKHGYTFVTDDQGRPSRIQGFLSNKIGDRSTQQTEVGQLGNEFDEGGHLIATRFNGPTDGFNLVPQNANLNRGEWKAMENEWADILNNGGQVEVGIQPIYLDDTRRPAGFDVIYRTIDESGENYVTKSFYNESSKKDQVNGN
jgi:filamentous hemagglutinin